jgi:hypothetical protein
MVIHYAPDQLRSNSDRPIANALIATSDSSYRTSDIPLGTASCSARSGRWALYPHGDQVVVVWPAGALAGPPVEPGGGLLAQRSRQPAGPRHPRASQPARRASTCLTDHAARLHPRASPARGA